MGHLTPLFPCSFSVWVIYPLISGELKSPTSIPTITTVTLLPTSPIRSVNICCIYLNACVRCINIYKCYIHFWLILIISILSIYNSLLQCLSWSLLCPSIATPAFFWFIFAWNMFFYPSTFIYFKVCVLKPEGCGFDLYLPDDCWCWTSFHVAIGHFDVFFENMSI